LVVRSPALALESERSAANTLHEGFVPVSSTVLDSEDMRFCDTREALILKADNAMAIDS